MRQEEERRHDRGRAPGPAAHPPARRSPRVVTALVAGLATFAWVQRQDARRAEADLAANQAGATPRHALGELAVHRPRAVAAAGHGGGVGDGRPRLRRARGDRRHPLGAAGARRAVRRHHRHADGGAVRTRRGAGRLGPPGRRADEPRRRSHRREPHRRRVPAVRRTRRLPSARVHRPGSSTSAARTPTPVPSRSTRPRSSSASRSTSMRRRRVAAQPRRHRRAVRPPRPRSDSVPSNLTPLEAAAQGIDADVYRPRRPRARRGWPRPAPCSTFGRSSTRRTLLDDYGAVPRLVVADRRATARGRATPDRSTA